MTICAVFQKLETMKLAVVGCTHGNLEKVYETIKTIESEKDCKVDLLLCCGDFQSVRNEHDVRSMVCSKDYHDMGTFYKYYRGDNVAPVLTIFIGGNHEASNYLQELPFGGWVAPNIYYLGYAGCVNVNGLRIAGISGIYKKDNYRRCHFEFPPYTDNTKRSVYHVRELEVFRLKQLSNKIDIFMSHDWPRNIDKFGNELVTLAAIRPHFQEDIENDCLGSPANKELLENLKPTHWFAGHMHCRFSALVPHDDGSQTKFLALDKAVMDGEERQFLQLLDIDFEVNDCQLSYDLEWVTILHSTQALVTGKKCNNPMPRAHGSTRWNYKPTSEEKENMLAKFNGNLTVPINVFRTTKPHGFNKKNNVVLNPQTEHFCRTLEIDVPLHSANSTNSNTYR